MPLGSEVGEGLHVRLLRSEVAGVILLKADTSSRGVREFLKGSVLTDLQVGKQLYESSLIHVDCCKVNRSNGWWQDMSLLKERNEDLDTVWQILDEFLWWS